MDIEELMFWVDGIEWYAEIVKENNIKNGNL
jgi:hypothetical protein